MVKKLSHEDIYKKSNIVNMTFNTSKDINIFNENTIYQKKAEEAIKFGLQMKQEGYNIFCSGNNSSKRKTLIKNILEEYAKNRPVPNDLCYIHNFEDEKKPILISLPAGKGSEFKKDMNTFSENLRKELLNLFDTNEYKKEVELLNQMYDDSIMEIFEHYEKKIHDLNYSFIQKDDELNFIPADENGDIIDVNAFNSFPESIKKTYIENGKKVEIIIVEYNHERNKLENKREEDLNKFDEKYVNQKLDPLLKIIKKKYIPLNKRLKKYFELLEIDILNNLEDFKEKEDTEETSVNILDLIGESKLEPSDLYKVNLLVDNKKLKTAPIIFPEEVDEVKLFGAISYNVEKNVVATNYNNIIAGDLLKANGGYIVLEVEDLFKVYGLWDRFLNTIRNKKINLSTTQFREVIIADSLIVEPIDIDVKVILVGSSEWYYLLNQNDSKFDELFDIHAVFENEISRDEDNELNFVKFIVKYIRDNNLKDFDKESISKITEYSSRLTDSQSKLTLNYKKIYRLLNEADAWATILGKDVVDLESVNKALQEQINRINIYDTLYTEYITSGTQIINVSGNKIGQINGLIVMDLGDYSIGKPARITANTYRGVKGVISVDREVEMTGPIYNKAVEIIKGYLGSLLGKKEPLSLTTAVSFEQNYGGIEGDSATVAELVAILSDMSELPIKQHFAVTGSMSQKGEVQAIGGINEKIEGFYEICKLLDPENEHGVVIPKSNMKNLMLNETVQTAVENGTFHIYAVDTIEEAVSILMGLSFETVINVINEKLDNLQIYEQSKKK